MLILEVSDEDIYDAMKQINHLKVPVSDGMQALFCHKTWSLPGKSVSNMVKSLFTLVC